MARRAALLSRWDDLPLEKVTEMVARKTVTGSRDVMTQMYLKQGAISPQHSHRTEQFIYVLQGALRLRVDNREMTIREGDVIEIPAAAPHQVEAIDDSFVMLTQGASGE